MTHWFWCASWHTWLTPCRKRHNLLKSGWQLLQNHFKIVSKCRAETNVSPAFSVFVRKAISSGIKFVGNAKFEVLQRFFGDFFAFYFGKLTESSDYLSFFGELLFSCEKRKKRLNFGNRNRAEMSLTFWSGWIIIRMKQTGRSCRGKADLEKCRFFVQ